MAFVMKHNFNLEQLQHVEANQRRYTDDELIEFKRDLVEAGNQVRIMLVEKI